jgi:hypothetical protein
MPPQEQQSQSRFAFFDQEAEAVYHPPWFVFGLAWSGIATGIMANLWQITTSVIAFFSLFALNRSQGAAYIGALLASIGMAITFQLGLMFFVFRVHQEMKTRKVASIDGTRQAAKETAVAMVSQHKILLVWTIISFMADTVGDFTFIGLLTSNAFLVFMYAASLYAASTILFSKALEKHQAASVAFANWRRFNLNIAIDAEKLRARAEREARKRA